jgi:hypothetical protein
MSDGSLPPVRPVSPDTQRWRVAAAELAPAKSYARLMDNGRFVITTVSTVGVLITGFGLIGADRLSDSTGPRVLAAAAVAIAVAAILLALWPLLAVRRDINLDNLAEVKAFYNDGLRKSKLITAAGRTVALALACAGIAGSWAAVESGAGPPQQTAASLTVLADPKDAKVHATASVAGQQPGTRVTLRLTAEAPGQPARTVVAGAAEAGGDGSATWDETIAAVPGATRYTLIVSPSGQEAVTIETDAQ